MADLFTTIKRKLSSRSNSSTSESNSPTDKCSRRTEDQGSVFGEEEEHQHDEVARTLKMAGDMATNLKAILAKLSKLDSIEAMLNAMSNNLAKVESEISKLKEDVSNTETKVEQLDGGLKWINNEVQQVQIKIKELDLAKEELHTKQL